MPTTQVGRGCTLLAVYPKIQLALLTQRGASGGIYFSAHPAAGPAPRSCLAAGTGLQFRPPDVRFYESQAWTGDCYNKMGDILVAVNTQPAAAVNVLVCDLSSSGGVLG